MTLDEIAIYALRIDHTCSPWRCLISKLSSSLSRIDYFSMTSAPFLRSSSGTLSSEYEDCCFLVTFRPSLDIFRNLSCVYLLLTRILRCLIFSLSWSSSLSLVGELTLYIYIWWTIFSRRFSTFISRSWFLSLIALKRLKLAWASLDSFEVIDSRRFRSCEQAFVMQFRDSSCRLRRMMIRFCISGCAWS